MEIIGTVESWDELVACDAVRVSREGNAHYVGDPVQEEDNLSVFIDGHLVFNICCSASHLIELALGRLYTEGIISSLEEIKKLVLHTGSKRIEITLVTPLVGDESQELEVVDTTGSCKSKAPKTDAHRLPLTPLGPTPWKFDWVFALADEFFEDKTAHARTHGVHSAYLARQGKTLCLREDIGRHNAFDKVIGWALLNHINLADCMLFTSGRVPTDMVTKAVHARIPLLVTKAVATNKTVEIARKYQLTLICRASSASLDVLSDPLSMTDSLFGGPGISRIA